jgi:hypothetical protein
MRRPQPGLRLGSSSPRQNLAPRPPAVGSSSDASLSSGAGEWVLGAVFLDPAATEHEKANANRFKKRLEEHLGQDATPERAWTGIMFRLGRVLRRLYPRPL